MNKLLMIKNKIMMVPVVMASINEAELENWIKGYTDPITNVLIWLIPIGGVLASLVTIVVWFAKDEELKQRDNPIRIVKKIVFWCLIGEGIIAIFKALGITSSGL
ncbi:MAG: hypothetical protein ACI4SR_08065 [Faecalibacillus sp.]